MKTCHLLAAGFIAASLTFATVGQAQAQATVQTVTTRHLGTVDEFSPETIVVHSDTAAPVRYGYSKTTTYVDETGAPVSLETVKSGLPVTVEYTKVGDQLIANRVIVRRTVTPVGTVIEKKTTVTTTTEKR